MKSLPTKQSRKLYLYAIPCFLIAWITATQTQLRECLSDSLDGVHYLLFLKSKSIQRGDIVSIQGHREDHVGDLKKWPYAKRVLGIPGDRIVRNSQGIIVIPQPSNTLSLLTKTSKGKPLTPNISNIIPEGYLFVAGDNPQSFDSRYEEFGLVHQEKVWGKAIWQW